MKKKIISYFNRSELLKGFSILMIGTLISQSLPLLISPVLSRLYSPEDFGLFSIFTTIVGLLSIVFTLKYEMAIAVAKSTKEAIGLLNLCISSTLFFFIVSLVIALISFQIIHFNPIYLWIPLSTLSFSLIAIIDRYYNYGREYSKMSILKISRTGIESAFNLIGLLKIFLKNNLIYSFLIGHYAALFFSLRNNQWLSQVSIDNLKWNKKNKHLALKYINFPKYTLPNTLVNTISSNIPIFLIPVFFGSKELGLYVFGVRIIQAPLAIISASLYNVLGQFYATNYLNYDLVKSTFKRVLLLSILVSVLLFPIFLFMPNLFEIAFGKKWYAAGQLILILYPSIVMNFIVATFAFVPVVLQKQKQALIMEFIFTSLKIMPFLLCLFIKDEFHKFIGLYSLLTSLYLVAALFWINQLLKTNRTHE